MSKRACNVVESAQNAALAFGRGPRGFLNKPARTILGLHRTIHSQQDKPGMYAWAYRA